MITAVVLGNPEGRDEIVIPHRASGYAGAGRTGDKNGAKVHLIVVNSCGRSDIEAFRLALGPRTAIASARTNNEAGTIFPTFVLGNRSPREYVATINQPSVV